MRMTIRGVLIALLAVSGGNALAQQSVEITRPWVRETVAAQPATGGFMEITSRPGGVLIGASSPVAGRVEVHQMMMEGNTMKMRPVDKLDLPAGKRVMLAPGGYHLMLLDLKKTLQAGTVVPLTLSIAGNDGKQSSVEVQAEVRKLGGVHQH
jgi:copper(I)-binding protein